MIDGTSHAQNDTKLIQHRRGSFAGRRRRLPVQARERSQRSECDVGDRAWFVPREEGLDPFEGGRGQVEGVEVAVVRGGRDNVGMAGRAVAESVLRRIAFRVSPAWRKRLRGTEARDLPFRESTLR